MTVNADDADGDDDDARIGKGNHATFDSPQCGLTASLDIILIYQLE